VLAELSPGRTGAGFGAGLCELIGVAHAHLRNALAYTLLIPRTEPGIRRFCLWAIGLAVLTLRRIAANPAYTSGAEVKVSRPVVWLIRISTSLVVGDDRMLKRLFELAARGLPLAAPGIGDGLRQVSPAGAAGAAGAAREDSAPSWRQPVL